jgi:probable rRNA maturation factor
MIEVNNLTKRRVDKEFLKKIAQKVLAKEKRRELELSVALIGQKRIKELNKKYRKKNRPTDVLSFKFDDFGEVVICPEEVKKNAKKYRSSFRQELARVLSHGILHILGHHHDDE